MPIPNGEPQPIETRRHVNVGERVRQAPGIVRAQRTPLQFVEPVDLDPVRARDEAVGEHLAEDRVVLTPTLPQVGINSLAPGDLHCVAARPPPTRISPAKNKPGHALGMTRRIFHRDRAALRQPEEDEPLSPGRFHDAFEIRHESVRERSSQSASDMPFRRPS